MKHQAQFEAPTKLEPRPRDIRENDCGRKPQEQFRVRTTQHQSKARIQAWLGWAGAMHTHWFPDPVISGKMTVADAPGAIQSAQHATVVQLRTDLGPCLTTEILVPGPVISGKTSMVDAPGAILSTQQAAAQRATDWGLVQWCFL